MIVYKVDETHIEGGSNWHDTWIYSTLTKAIEKMEKIKNEFISDVEATRDTGDKLEVYNNYTCYYSACADWEDKTIIIFIEKNEIDLDRKTAHIIEEEVHEILQREDQAGINKKYSWPGTEDNYESV